MTAAPDDPGGQHELGAVRDDGPGDLRDRQAQEPPEDGHVVGDRVFLRLHVLSVPQCAREMMNRIEPTNRKSPMRSGSTGGAGCPAAVALIGRTP